MTDLMGHHRGRFFGNVCFAQVVRFCLKTSGVSGFLSIYIYLVRRVEAHNVLRLEWPEAVPAPDKM